MEDRLRIACLLPAATDICIALGLADQIVGVTHECDYPGRSGLSSSEDTATTSDSTTTTTTTTVAGGVAGYWLLTRDGLGAAHDDDDAATYASQGQIHLAVQQQSQNNKNVAGGSVENALYPMVPNAWASARPNLVITQDLCAVCGPTSAEVCRMEKQQTSIDNHGTPTGPSVVVSLSPHSLNDIVDCIKTVATACRVDESKTTAVVQEFASRIERVQRGARLAVPAATTTTTTTMGRSRRPTAVLLEWLDPPFDSGHWIPDMLETAGFTQALPKPPGGKSSVITWEQVQRAAPDVVIVACCGFGLVRNLRDACRHGASFPTSTARRVYAVDGNRYFARPGPQLSWGVVILAQIAADATQNTAYVAAISPEDLASVRRGVAWDIVDVVVDDHNDDNNDQHRGDTISSCDMEDVADNNCSNNEPAFDDLHRRACERGEVSYTDPVTGYNVFTELAHRKRGKCCGSGCRHCPFHHVNVHDKASHIQRPALLYRAGSSSSSDSTDHGDNGVVAVVPPLKVLFFSGGKDSFLTIRALLRQRPRPTVVLLTTFDATSRIVAHQEVDIRDIQRQAEHLDLTLIGVPLHRGSGTDYVDRVREGLSLVEITFNVPISALVFGDLHLEHIRLWRDDRVGPLGYATEYPLWHVNYEVLLQDLLASQVVCEVSASSTDHVRVGTIFNAALYEQLERSDSGVDTFGERGEFHSFAKVWTVSRQTALGLNE